MSVERTEAACPAGPGRTAIEAAASPLLQRLVAVFLRPAPRARPEDSTGPGGARLLR